MVSPLKFLNWMDCKNFVALRGGWGRSRSGEMMRGAFIVQFGAETKPAEGIFEGWAQEVDTCTEFRFHSSVELLKFLGERFELTLRARKTDREGDVEGIKTLPCQSKKLP
jgi:hypothetical protein